MEPVAVLLVTHNTRELTLAALRSVEESDGPEREIVVVDNGSSDGTEAAVTATFPQVTFLRSERNLGFAKANNWAAQQSRAAWILLLNSDARLEPGALKTALDYMAAHPDCGVLGAQLVNEDGTRQNSIANFPTLTTELLNKSLLRRLRPRRYPGKEHPFTEPAPVDSVIGAFFLTPRRVWDALGGLDERFFFFLEETDYCLQARRRGWITVHHPGIRVRHRGGGSAKHRVADARIEYWRSRYGYFRKNAEPWIDHLLRLGLGLRLGMDWLANGVAAAVSLGRIASVRRRFGVYHALLRWHLSGCPEGPGLPR